MLVDGGNLYQMDIQTGKLSLIIPGQSGEWRSIKPARAGGLWVRDGQSLRRWLGAGWVEDRGVTDLQVTENAALYETKSGDLVVGTLGMGVLFLDDKFGQHKLGHVNGLSHDQVFRSVKTGRKISGSARFMG